MEIWELKQMQALPLEAKIQKSKQRIKEWYEFWNGQVYVSFSGGVDSTALLHLVRSIYPEVPAMYVDTGLEYPELRTLVKSTENVIWMKPKKHFTEIIKNYGYPVISKKVAKHIRRLQNPTEKNAASRKLALEGITRAGNICKTYKLPKKWIPLANAPFKVSEVCCAYMKHEPFNRYEKITGRKAIVGLMAEDSQDREQAYIKHGCNSFASQNGGRDISEPFGFWIKSDILEYIKLNNVDYCRAVYGNIVKTQNGRYKTTGCQRTGCMFCMFGVHKEKDPNRFQQMYFTHPKLWDYCINKLNLKDVLNYINVRYEPNPYKNYGIPNLNDMEQVTVYDYCVK